MVMQVDNNEKIIKVFNNNIILVNSNETEKILFAKGIGFGRKPGHIIEKGTNIDKVFIIENEENRINLKNMVEQIDNQFFCICEEAIYGISKRVDKELNENVHVGLIDHLYFTVKRIKENQPINNPFLVEIQTLYKDEFRLAELVVNKIEKNYSITLPKDEVAFIALHIHSALTDQDTSNTLKDSYLVNKIIKLLEKKFNIKIDTESIDYARFIAHLKFTIKRINDNKPSNNLIKDLIKQMYKVSYEIAIEISKLIEEELNLAVNEDETAFLAIHIERLRIPI